MKNVKYKRYYNYFAVIIGFFIGIVIIFAIIDSYILPAMIHSTETTTVPDLRGMTLKEAREALEANDLRYIIAAEQYSEEYKEDCVINQKPKANDKVRCGRHVNITISKGGETVIMPRIVKRSLRATRVSLMQRGLHIGNITYEYSNEIGADTVISQSIPPRKYIAYSSYVDITVSKGLEAEIQVPLLTGKSIDIAEKILKKYRLLIGNIDYSNDEIYEATYMPNTIIDQFPSPNELVVPETTVDITIYR